MRPSEGNVRDPENIMPAQQSGSQEDEEEDDKVKEVPRQSVLSNLVESSISNFENESQGEVDGLNALNTKQMIRLDPHKRQHKRHRQQRRSGTSTDLAPTLNKLSKVAKAQHAQPDGDEARPEAARKQAPGVKLDPVDKQAKDIDSDNNDQLSADQDELTVPAPLRGSYMSGKSRHDETRNSHGNIEVRGVETIEEFFRPEFAQNTQSLGDINDDSDEEELPVRASAFSDKRGGQVSKFKMPQFSDDDSGDDSNVPIDIGQDANKAQFRNMGFPNMNYLDPESHGPPVQNQTFYKEFEDDRENDIKRQREGFINARENMPNNTFIKLFHNLAGEEDGEGENGMRGDGAKQDELQSIQYVDQNYVESSMETDTEGLFGVVRPMHEAKKDVKILYNPAKNKSKSLGRVGPADQFNQFNLLSKGESSGKADSQTNVRQRKGSMAGSTLLGGIGQQQLQPAQQQSVGRRNRVKASSSEKLPPLRGEGGAQGKRSRHGDKPS